MKLECHQGPVLCYAVPAGCFVAMMALAYALWVCCRMYVKKHRKDYESKMSAFIDEALMFCSDPGLLPPCKMWEAAYDEVDSEEPRSGHTNMIFNRDGTVLGSGSDAKRSYVLYGKFDSSKSKLTWVEVERGVLREENTYDMQGLLLDNEELFLRASKRDPVITVCEGQLHRVMDRTLVCTNTIQGRFWTSRGSSGTMVIKTETDSSSRAVTKGDLVLNITDIPHACPGSSKPASPLHAVAAASSAGLSLSLDGSTVVEGELVSTDTSLGLQDGGAATGGGACEGLLCEAVLADIDTAPETAAAEDRSSATSPRAMADSADPHVVAAFLTRAPAQSQTVDLHGQRGPRPTLSVQEPSFRRFKAVVQWLPKEPQAAALSGSDSGDSDSDSVSDSDSHDSDACEP